MAVGIKIEDGKVPAGIYPQELKDPDYVETLVSTTYMDKLNSDLMEKVKKLTQDGKRVPNDLRKKMMSVSQRKAVGDTLIVDD